MQINSKIAVETIFVQTDAERLQQVLSVLSPGDGENGILIISGGCCHPLLAAEEEALENNIHEVLREGSEGTVVKKIALSDVKKVMHKLDPRLTASVSGLINERGSAEALPIVLINGQMAFYGGVPTNKQLRSKLRELSAGKGSP